MTAFTWESEHMEAMLAWRRRGSHLPAALQAKSMTANPASVQVSSEALEQSRSRPITQTRKGS